MFPGNLAGCFLFVPGITVSYGNTRTGSKRVGNVNTASLGWKLRAVMATPDARRRVCVFNFVSLVCPNVRPIYADHVVPSRVRQMLSVLRSDPRSFGIIGFPGVAHGCGFGSLIPN